MKISASSCWVWKKLVFLQLQQPEFDLLLSFFFIASNNKNKDALKEGKKKKKIFQPNQTQKKKKNKNKNWLIGGWLLLPNKQKDTKQDESFAPRDHRALNRHCTVALQACQLERESQKEDKNCAELRGESVKGVMMELKIARKKERSTLLRQKCSSGENDAVRGEEVCRTWG
jgi:hypothetical protein